MADENEVDPPQDIPTNFLLMKTRSRIPWAIVILVAVMAGAAGGLLWYFVGR